MRAPRLVLWTGAILAASLLAACTRPLVPHSAAPSAVTSALPASTSAASPAPTPPPVSAHKPILGVDLYVLQNYPTAIVRRDAIRDLSYIKSVLGVQSIGIVWNLISPSDHSNAIEQDPARSLSPAKVELITKLAQADGFSVEYRPLVKVRQGAQWEGHIFPASQSAWFDSYYQAELPYLQLAQKLHVREVVVGTELAQLESSHYWSSFLGRVAGVYHGITSYATYNMAAYWKSWYLVPARQYGVDPYPNVMLPDSASVSQLVAAWDQQLRRVPPGVLAWTALDEVGIPAEQGAYHHPWDWNTITPLNETVQARWFTAACTVAAKYHMRAIYFFNVNLTDYPAKPPFPSPPTFEGKTGAKAIHDCANIFRAGTG